MLKNHTIKNFIIGLATGLIITAGVALAQYKPGEIINPSFRPSQNDVRSSFGMKCDWNGEEHKQLTCRSWGNDTVYCSSLKVTCDGGSVTKINSGKLVIDYCSGCGISLDCDAVCGTAWDVLAPEKDPFCADGLDNDQDTYFDCNDPGCFGSSDCPRETICWDGIDNDFDTGQPGGGTDCYDSDCATHDVCEIESICWDNINNDFISDSHTDCKDLDCDGIVGVAGGNCNPLAGPLFQCCEYGSELTCDDRFDNDRDTRIDCFDFADCSADPWCQAETICDDGYDNDADGPFDCADSDCDLAPGCFEAICNDRIDDEPDGAEDCFDSDCSADPWCQAETICNDNYNNDAEGEIDCRDPDCNGQQGGAPGELCELGIELSCTDGFDNDGLDGDDCNDDDCWDKVGDSVTGAFCRWIEGRDSGDCYDNFDNDDDGRRDCRDDSCSGEVGDPLSGAVCQFGAETTCDDGFDNNANGLTDCSDSDCDLNPACPVPENTNSRCSDGFDNDFDNLFNCEDPDCNSRRGGSNPTDICEFGAETLGRCSDGFDNDADGTFDCGDAECSGVGSCP